MLEYGINRIWGIRAPSLRLRTPAEICVKYGLCSRCRLAPVAHFHDKIVRMSLCIRVDVNIELSYGSVQLDMLKLRGSLGQLTMGTMVLYDFVRIPLFLSSDWLRILLRTLKFFKNNGTFATSSVVPYE